MVTSMEDEMHLLEVVCAMAANMRVDGLQVDFWTDIVEPVASVVVRASSTLTEKEQVLMMCIATKAVHKAARDPDARDTLAAAIRGVGGDK